MRLPKNIAKMTDKERRAWAKALPPSDYNKACEKTFRTVEYLLSHIDTNGDNEPEFFDSKEEAVGALKKWKADEEYVAVVLERSICHWNAIDTELEDRRYETLEAVGCLKALEAGGWI